MHHTQINLCTNTQFLSTDSRELISHVRVTASGLILFGSFIATRWVNFRQFISDVRSEDGLNTFGTLHSLQPHHSIINVLVSSLS